MTDYDSEAVPVSRLTVATAADRLREYRQEVEQVAGGGSYVQELSETIEQLEQALQD